MEILCVSALILGMNLGGNELPWTHPLILTILPLSAVFFILFIIVEGKFANEPIMPLYLLSHRTPLSAALVLSSFDISYSSQIGSRRWEYFLLFTICPSSIKSF
jgi:hypothetical protein